MTARVAILGLTAVLFIGCAAPEKQPNLLIVTLDTTRADHFGYSGHQSARTPHFDAFAAERAISFDNTITAVPVTFPSHTTIMTGTFPVFHGVHDNDGYFLDDSVTTLAEILQSAGFTTGAVLAAFPLDSEVNLDQGFDTYDDDYQADWTAAELAERGPFSFGFLERKADRVNQAVARWFDEHQRERFFLWVHYFDPHQPYDPPPPYDSLSAGNLYDGEMAFLDENFGKLLKMLDTRGLTDNTIIVIVGDHGEALEEHGEPTHAHFIYDATMRVPLLVAVPGTRFRPGSRIDTQVRTADIAPTVLDLLDLATGSEMQGTSLVPFLEDPELDGSLPALLENYYNKFHYGWAPMRGLRTDRFKFIEAPNPELYDLDQDPNELVNLAPSDPQKVADHREKLQQFVRRFESENLGRSTAAQVDDETRQKLEALGYLGGGSTVSERAAPFPTPEELAELTDPKSRSEILKYINFINEMMRAQRPDEALEIIRNALALDPENYRLNVFAAQSLAALRQWNRALEASKRAQALRPEDAESYYISGQIHIRRGEYELALEPLQRAVELFPQNVQAIHQLAATYLALGRDEEAIRHFEAVLALDDSRWVVMADLATAYARTGRATEARDTLQKALELKPYSSTLRYRIAAFYREMGNLEFSRRMLEETLRISPDHLSANLDLGEQLLAEGDGSAGRPYLERVIELAPQSTQGREASRLLEGASSN